MWQDEYRLEGPLHQRKNMQNCHWFGVWFWMLLKEISTDMYLKVYVILWVNIHFCIVKSWGSMNKFQMYVLIRASFFLICCWYIWKPALNLNEYQRTKNHKSKISRYFDWVLNLTRLKPEVLHLWQLQPVKINDNKKVWLDRFVNDFARPSIWTYRLSCFLTGPKCVTHIWSEINLPFFLQRQHVCSISYAVVGLL